MASLLQARDLRKAFGGLVAVNGVSLSVSPGEVLGLIGPNGSGKTTLLNLIAGTIRSDAGAILMNGEDVTRLPIICGFAGASTVPSSSCACRPTFRRSRR